MHSRRTEGGFTTLRRVSGIVLAAVLVACGSRHGILYVAGESMVPALRAGDMIVYRRYGPVAQVGDLVVYEHDDALVVHRVAGCQLDGSLRTRGDANATPDADPVLPDAVRGVVAVIVPLGKALTVLERAWSAHEGGARLSYQSHTGR